MCRGPFSTRSKTICSAPVCNPERGACDELLPRSALTAANYHYNVCNLRMLLVLLSITSNIATKKLSEKQDRTMLTDRCFPREAAPAAALLLLFFLVVP
jgi:hypothetical protein